MSPSGTSASTEPASKESKGPVPGLLRPDRVVLGSRNTARPHRSLVGEGMMGQVAMEIEGHAGRAQLVLQRVDGGDRKKLILRGPMPLQRRFDFGRVDVFKRRAAVPNNGRVYLRGHACAEQRQCAPH